MYDKWQFIVQLPVTQDMLFDIRCLTGVKDVYGEGALLTVVPESKTITFDALHRWLSCYLRQKHESTNRFTK